MMSAKNLNALLPLLLLVISSPVGAIRLVQFPVCTNTADQEQPAISGHTIVWIDSRNGNRDIYGYNLDTQQEFPICTRTYDQGYDQGLAISGNNVVYHSATAQGWKDLYGYTLPSGPEFLIAGHDNDSKTNPVIDGDTVVWLSYRTLYAKHLGGGAFVVSNSNCGRAAISGDIVVWPQYVSGAYYYDIYGKNIQTNDEFSVCTYWSGNAATSSKSRPAVSGNIVVWQDTRNGTVNSDIYGKNLTTNVEFPICTNTATQANPAISGNIVVWVDNRSGRYEIYGKNLRTGEEFAVTTQRNLSGPGMVAIDGNLIVWDDVRNGNLDIYGAYFANSDLNHDGPVTFVDFAALANQWVQTGCGLPDFCGGADLDLSGTVDAADLNIFTQYWLEGVEP